MHRSHGLMLLAFAVTGCVTTTDDVVESVDSEIVGSSAEAGFPDVMFIELVGQGSCTGTLIAPRVVLTAKHCILNFRNNPAGVRIGVGNSFDPSGPQRKPPQPMISASQRYSEVIEVRTTEGDDTTDKDLALLLLKTAGTVTPRAWVATGQSLDSTVSLTAVGFGQRVIGPLGTNDQSGRPSLGQKFSRKNISVTDADRWGFVMQGPTSCYGDSGAPAILADGRVVGISRAVGNCKAPSAYTRTKPFAELINQALVDTGSSPVEANQTPNSDDMSDIDDDQSSTTDPAKQPSASEHSDSEGDAASGCSVTSEHAHIPDMSFLLATSLLAFIGRRRVAVTVRGDIK